MISKEVAALIAYRLEQADEALRAGQQENYINY